MQKRRAASEERIFLIRTFSNCTAPVQLPELLTFLAFQPTDPKSTRLTNERYQDLQVLFI
jgi:hypothetical protein